MFFLPVWVFLFLLLGNRNILFFNYCRKTKFNEILCAVFMGFLLNELIDFILVWSTQVKTILYKLFSN